MKCGGHEMNFTLAQRQMLTRIESGAGTFVPYAGEWHTIRSLARLKLIQDSGAVEIEEFNGKIRVCSTYKLTLKGIATLAQLRKSGAKGSKPIKRSVP